MITFRRLLWLFSPLVLPLAAALIWETQVRRAGGTAYAYPPIGDIVKSFATLINAGDLGRSLEASFVRACLGLSLGAGAGLFLGIAMASFRPIRSFLSPLVHSFRQVPLFAWLPLIALWAGNGEAAKLLIVALAVLCPVLLGTEEGLIAAEQRLIDVGRLYGFRRARLFFHIGWPAALPHVLTSLSQGIAFAWMATIGCEMLFGSGEGLGVLMQQGEAGARLDVVMVCVICVGAAGLAMSQLLAILRRRALRGRPLLNV